jgi:hypothetical protein
MSQRTDFWAAIEKRQFVKDAEANGEVADSKEVRLALMRKVHAGEITLEQAQAELKRIKSGAKASGKMTRAQAYRAG